MQSESNDVSNALPHTNVAPHPLMRWGLRVLGIIMVVLGLIGVIVPGLPTTVFLIVALWAFSRSSPKFQEWLWNHPRLGPSLRNWYLYKIIPTKAKVMAVSVMAMSLIVIAYLADDNLVPFIMVTAVLIPTAVFICTRPSHRRPCSPTDRIGVPESVMSSSEKR